MARGGRGRRGHGSPTRRQSALIEGIAKIFGGLTWLFTYLIVFVTGFSIGCGVIVAALVLGKNTAKFVIETISQISKKISDGAGQIVEGLIVGNPAIGIPLVVLAYLLLFAASRR